MEFRSFSTLAAASLVTLLASPVGFSQDAGAEDELGEVVVTGTRVANRTALDTVAPVDVISAESLANVGTPAINQALSITVPAFNFPRPGLADGTDTIRPATLRGLAPDQSLVLVNSKRRHSAALVNVNATVGRGSSAVDLNTIPSAMVRAVEVLRDGASAQYGSDAIAGVINLRLREDREGGAATIQYGQRVTKYDALTSPLTGVGTAPPAGFNWNVPPETASRSRSDGQTITASAWKGFGFGETGYLTVALEYRDQERTERSGYDWRQLYDRPTSTTFDAREQSIDRWTAWYGEPEIQQSTAFVNMGVDLGDSAKLYGWASYQNREARSAGFFRTPNDTRNIPSIYPNGFLPIIAPDVDDYSAALGIEWRLGGWDMDTSLVYGKNEMAFTIENTLNRSIGPTSRTEFDAGGYDYDQLVLNVSGVHQFQVGWAASPLNVAAGIEARRESYGIFAGEPDSWRNGGILYPLGAPGCTAPTALDTQRGGCATPSGAQVFPGFRPANVTDESRDAIGAYVDLEANLTDKLLASVAVRGEDYSDFGSNVSGKLALRYDFTPGFALRGAVQNGFRAPSLQQQFFTTTSTNFINGVPFDITTFPVTDPVAIALGAQPLDAEKSLNFSLGAIFRLERANITIDAYRIDIDDRIVLSENLTQANVRTFLQQQGFVGVGGGRFFINGVDTRTQGLDVVINVPLDPGPAGQFDLTLAANFNDTDVLKVPSVPQLAALSPAPPLFDRNNVLTFEEGTPNRKVTANVNWKRDAFGGFLRATHYGRVLAPGTTAANDFVMSPKTLVDLEGRVTMFGGLDLALGVENVFDTYPDALPPRLNTTSNTAFSNLSPFGRGGRLVYGRLTYSF